MPAFFPDDDPPDVYTPPSEVTVPGPATPRNRRLRPGDMILGRYTVLSELGEGGMGVVYKCLDTVGGIEVAIKCLPPELARNEGEMEGIRENYAIVARLHHSAISGLRQLEKDSASGEYYLVMDLAGGEDLSAILRRRHGEPMPLDMALAILRPLASALDYAHGERVLHRDVKPANVKVAFGTTGNGQRDTENGGANAPRVQLLDFGLAAEVRTSMARVSMRGHAGSSGTPAYMAPEQWEARRQSAATDQYALAVMAYQMLAGYLPFDALDQNLLKDAVLTRPPEEIKGIPAHVNAALMRALAKNPKERFPSCVAFVEACVSPPNPETRNPQGAMARSPNAPQEGTPDSALSEAEVLRRRLLLNRAVKTIAQADRDDNEFRPFVEEAELELTVAEDACKFGRFGAAVESLSKAQKALDALTAAKAVRKAHEEAERREREEAEHKAGDILPVTVAGVSFNLRWCPPGSFTMGSPPSEDGRFDIEEPHPVTLTKGFWMGETEVSQRQWNGVMGTTVVDMAAKALADGNVYEFASQSSPGRFWRGTIRQRRGGAAPEDLCYNTDGNAPIYWVSWNDAQDFCRRLTEHEEKTGWLPPGYAWRLPTEAEWEFACRAGTGTTLPNGEPWHIYGNMNAPALDRIAWYGGNSAVGWDGPGSPVENWIRIGCQMQHPIDGGRAAMRRVDQKNPNAWGMRDMLGNVWEWCHDWMGPYPQGEVRDPVGPSDGQCRVVRGGSWYSDAAECRPACRWRFEQGFRYWTIGFRVVLGPQL